MLGKETPLARYFDARDAYLNAIGIGPVVRVTAEDIKDLYALMDQAVIGHTTSYDNRLHLHPFSLQRMKINGSFVNIAEA